MQLVRSLCKEAGMNCYFETHIDRLSEDPIAFDGILKVCDEIGPKVEVNADLSHYLYRGLDRRTPEMRHILSRVGHMHQRMARVHGDLSVQVEDPEKDWAEKGVTWNAFEYSVEALKGGLSSRAVCGESGPIHACTDPLTNDAKMVPLLKKMAQVADGKETWPLSSNPFTV
uniref:Xylose isomerase-like TIM barrel domain-containing protein n=2 Tax=Lotharella oceanica TaxID=641309 RepID=A0A7S2TK11_9EUKA|mmetsp:Transcript_17313/g.32858  ORF Transcript_17313/g.32858 Transcript_17313/m.32858 type:complete len:171 (+) Transcript_17313:277-789(+)